MDLTNNLVAYATVTVHAPIDRVWEALTDAAKIKKYMMGTSVSSDWQEGSEITWEGEWQGHTYKDKGRITRFRPKELLQYTHYSPISNKPDVPENYHTVTIHLEEKNGHTEVALSQDKNDSEAEKEHSQKNWETILASMKILVEEHS